MVKKQAPHVESDVECVKSANNQTVASVNHVEIW